MKDTLTLIICDLHNIDITSELYDKIFKKISKQLDDSSKDVKNKDIITCEHPIYFNKMLQYIHISPGSMTEDANEINITRPDILSETLALPEFYCRYCSFARFVINKKELSLKVWRLKTDCQADYTFLNAFHPFE